MKTNHQMNYYDYGKNLDIQGVVSVIGGGVNPEPEPELPNSATLTYYQTAGTYQITVELDTELSEGYELGNLICEDSGGTKYDVSVTWNTSNNITYTSSIPQTASLIYMMSFELEIKHNGTVCKTINVTRSY